MLIRIVAVGTKMPAWVGAAVDDYARRMPPDWRVEWREVRAEPRGASGHPAAWMQREAERIRAALPQGARLVVMDERGRDLDTRQLAQRVAAWRDEAQPVAIVIGGPDGLDPALADPARPTPSRGTRTRPPPLVRVLLAEQLFRAWSILAGHPYHRE